MSDFSKLCDILSGLKSAIAVSKQQQSTLPPKGTVYFITPRKPSETDEEWAKRCAVLTNVGESPGEEK